MNRFKGNGHVGVVVHGHAPGADFSGNQIHDDHYAIFTSGPVTLAGGHNYFRNVTAQLGTFPTF